MIARTKRLVEEIRLVQNNSVGVFKKHCSLYSAVKWSTKSVVGEGRSCQHE